MKSVTEADDLAVVEEVVFAQRGDAAGGGPETGIAGRLDRHLDPGCHDERRGAAVRQMIWCGFLQDLVRGRLDSARPHSLGLGTLHTLVVVHSLPDNRRWDEAPIQPFLRLTPASP